MLIIAPGLYAYVPGETGIYALQGIGDSLSEGVVGVKVGHLAVSCTGGALAGAYDEHQPGALPAVYRNKVSRFGGILAEGIPVKVYIHCDRGVLIAVLFHRL